MRVLVAYRIGSIEVDPRTYEVRHAGNLVPVEPQVFDLLILLIENRHRVVTKDEIFGRIWNGRIVTESALSSRIKAARQALGDSGSEQALIRTVHGRGFRFLGDVEEISAPAAAATHIQLSAASDRPVDVAGSSDNGDLQPPQAGPGGAFGPRGVFGSSGRRIVATIRGWQGSWGIAASVCGIVLAAAYLTMHLLAGAAAPSSTGVERANLSAGAPVSEPLRPSFKDCALCPEMVPLPPGDFMMGSHDDEPFRNRAEGSPRRVTIAKGFAIGRFEVTIDQFSAFVAETGADAGKSCLIIEGDDGNNVTWGPLQGSYRQPGFEVTGAHPAACVSWHDAQGYAAWLRRRTGKQYRLPTETEWEYAARAGTTTLYSFGNDQARLCENARFADLDSSFSWRWACRSATTSYGPIPVGRLKPNAWGIFDMHGNVWEWAEDCWTSNPLEIPRDGSALVRQGKCEVGVIRGGSWAAGPGKLRSAFRAPMVAAARRNHVGFRVALGGP